MLSCFRRRGARGACTLKRDVGLFSGAPVYGDLEAPAPAPTPQSDGRCQPGSSHILPPGLSGKQRYSVRKELSAFEAALFFGSPRL